MPTIEPERPVAGNDSGQPRSILVKVGGQVGSDPDAVWLSELADVWSQRMKLVVVHGGGPLISEALRRRGVEPQFVDGHRVTDRATLDVVVETLCGGVNKRLVGAIQRTGLPAVGLSGVDGGMIRAVKRPGTVDLGFTGDVQQVDPALLKRLMEAGFLPVVAPVSLGSESLLNVNADAAAVALAVALPVDRFVMLTDVPGVLADPDDLRSVIHGLTVEQAESMLDTGTIQGGMRPKVRACLAAARAGIESTILDGRRSGILSRTLLENAGEERVVGTTIGRSASG